MCLPKQLARPRLHARDVIAKYLDGIDDVRIAERVAERIRCGDEEVVPLEQVMKRYDLED